MFIEFHLNEHKLLQSSSTKTKTAVNEGDTKNHTASRQQVGKLIRNFTAHMLSSFNRA
jgi:hypothetical protein